MSTNFHWLVEVKTPFRKLTTLDLDSDHPDLHIGWLSYIGAYCKRCDEVFGPSGTFPNPGQCPKCNSSDEVHPANEFHWVQDQQGVLLACVAKSDEIIIVNEYGDELTGSDFLHKLRNCVKHQRTR